jgi:hypothetical protein
MRDATSNLVASSIFGGETAEANLPQCNSPPKKDVSSIFGDDLCSIPMVKCLEKKGTLRRRLEFRKYIADFSTVYLLS